MLEAWLLSSRIAVGLQHAKHKHDRAYCHTLTWHACKRRKESIVTNPLFVRLSKPGPITGADSNIQCCVAIEWRTSYSEGGSKNTQYEPEYLREWSTKKFKHYRKITYSKVLLYGCIWINRNSIAKLRTSLRSLRRVLTWSSRSSRRKIWDGMPKPWWNAMLSSYHIYFFFFLL